MQFYYSKSCPHSLSMLEILTKFQTNYQPTDIEMIDVHDVTIRLPSEIKGTPTIFTDGRFFHGDDAFERISSVEIGSRARPSINSAMQRSDQSDTIETINEHPNTQHTNNQNNSRRNLASIHSVLRNGWPFPHPVLALGVGPARKRFLTKYLHKENGENLFKNSFNKFFEIASKYVTCVTN